jgi:uncharacterized membrane protein
MSGMPSRRRWLTLALLASIGLNLVFLGLAAGTALHGPPHRDGPEGRWGPVAALPDPYRHDLMRAMRDERDSWIGRREAMRGQRAAMGAALTAEPFDPEAVRAALKRERDTGAELMRRGSDMLLDQIRRMSPADRAAYAEALTRERPPGRDGRD